MSVLFTADIHLSENPRDEYRKRWYENLPHLVRKLDCDTVVIGGDLTEEKEGHRAPFINWVADKTANLAKRVTTIFYKGNHDYVQEDEPFFQFLRHTPNVHFITTPSLLGVKGFGGCLFLPHTRNHVRDWKGFDVARDGTLVFCHNAFEGANVGFGRKAKGIPTGVFGNRKRVFAGDIHIAQKIGCVRYVGAPYTVDFGDDYDPRVLRISPQGTESVPQIGPQKVLVECTPDHLVDALEEIETVKGDVVKVRIRIGEFDKDKFKKLNDLAVTWAAMRGVWLYQCVPMREAAQGERIRRTATVDRRDDQQTFEAFGRKRGVDGKTMKTGRAIMEASK